MESNEKENVEFCRENKSENELLESELKDCFTYNEYNLKCDHKKQLRTCILSSHNKNILNVRTVKNAQTQYAP